MVYLSELKITREIENTLWKQIETHSEYPWFYSVITYSEWIEDFDKEKFDFANLPKVRKTQRMVRRMLKEAFKAEYIYFFNERHQPFQQNYYQQFDIPTSRSDLLPKEIQKGDAIDNGRFHTNILISNIEDKRIKEPNSKCRRLFDSQSHCKIPIRNTHYTNLESLKIDLIDACCKQPEWVCNHQDNAVKTQCLHTPYNVKNVLHYCLKDCYNKGTDFTEIIDFSNSDFNT